MLFMKVSKRKWIKTLNYGLIWIYFDAIKR